MIFLHQCLPGRIDEMTMLMAQCQREFSMLKSDALRARSNLRRIKHLLGRHFRPYYIEVTKYTCKKKKRKETLHNLELPRQRHQKSEKESKKKKKKKTLFALVYIWKIDLFRQEIEGKRKNCLLPSLSPHPYLLFSVKGQGSSRKYCATSRKSGL